jgi:hypothetical protein
MIGRTARRVGWSLLVSVGLALVAVAAVPRLAGSLPVEAWVAMAGNDYVLLGAFGALSLLVLAVMLVRRAAGHVQQATPPDAENVRDAPRPGDEIDRYLRKWSVDNPETAEQIRDRLRTVAVWSLVRTSAVSRDAARQQVDTGAWTDDPVAGAFLEAGGSGPSVRQRVLLALRGERWSQYGARRTVEALLDRFEEEAGR